MTPEHKDFVSYKLNICACPGLPPKVGIPLAFWEPLALIDVTRIPYKLISLGGVSIGSTEVKLKGSISNIGESGRSSYYNVHYIKFPLLTWLDVIPGFSCAEKGDIDIAYLSEFDPFWNDGEWSSVLNPEIFLFANPLAQTACMADCTTSSLNHPNDKFFWCGGCAGSLYPLIGHVAHHVGAIQASHLLVNRLLAKLHTLGMMTGFAEENFCQKKPIPRLKKTIYKTQLVKPIANTQGPCNALGKSDVVWGASKSYPYGGEDFSYLIWGKKHCCLDAVEVATSIIEGVP